MTWRVTTYLDEIEVNAIIGRWNADNYDQLAIIQGIHNELIERDADDAHPINSITGLQDELDSKSEFSGSYNDLDDKPTIPAAQVNSDWNDSGTIAEILNKPTILTEAQVNDIAFENAIIFG